MAGSPAIRGWGLRQEKQVNVFSPLGLQRARPWLAPVLGVGSEHGRGVIRPFGQAWNNWQAASFGLGRGPPLITWMPRGGSSGWTSQKDSLCLRGRALSLPLSSLVIECPVTLGMICPKSQHKSLAQAGSAQRLWAGQQRPLVREGRTFCTAAQDMC